MSETLKKSKQSKDKDTTSESSKDFVGPKYVGLVHRQGGNRYRLEMNKLERKILAGNASDDEKHRYYLVSGQRASDLET
jgi:hypothetical protein